MCVLVPILGQDFKASSFSFSSVLLTVKGSTLGDHWGYLFAHPELRLRMYVNHQTSHFLCYAIGISLSIQLDMPSQRLCYLAILAHAEYSSLSLDWVYLPFSYCSWQLPSSSQLLQLASSFLTPLSVISGQPIVPNVSQSCM